MTYFQLETHIYAPCYLRGSQCTPPYPVRQSQVKPLRATIHVPLFSHGELEHSSNSEINNTLLVY